MLHLLLCDIRHTFLNQHPGSGGELSHEVHFWVSSGSLYRFSAWATSLSSHWIIIEVIRLSKNERQRRLTVFISSSLLFHKPCRWSTMAWRGESSLTAKVRGPTTPCGSWRNTEEATKRSEVTGYDVAARSHDWRLWLAVWLQTFNTLHALSPLTAALSGCHGLDLYPQNHVCIIFKNSIFVSFFSIQKTHLFVGISDAKWPQAQRM